MTSHVSINSHSLMSKVEYLFIGEKTILSCVSLPTQFTLLVLFYFLDCWSFLVFKVRSLYRKKMIALSVTYIVDPSPVSHLSCYLFYGTSSLFHSAEI